MFSVCTNANDVTDDVIGKHMVGVHGNDLTIYISCNWHPKMAEAVQSGSTHTHSTG